MMLQNTAYVNGLLENLDQVLDKYILTGAALTVRYSIL